MVPSKRLGTVIYHEKCNKGINQVLSETLPGVIEYILTEGEGYSLTGENRNIFSMRWMGIRPNAGSRYPIIFRTRPNFFISDWYLRNRLEQARQHVAWPPTYR